MRHGGRRRRAVFAQPFHSPGDYRDAARQKESTVVDAVYLLLLALLYAVTHGLVWALDQLGESP